MPLLSTLGAGSAWGRDGTQRTAKFAETGFFAAPINGNLVLSSDKDIRNKDIILVWQVAASSSYSTLPAYADYGGTGFTVAAGRRATDGTKVHVGNISYKVCDGTEAGTTIGGFMVEGTDGYNVADGRAYLLRPTYDYSSFTVYSTNSVGSLSTVGTITAKYPKDTDAPFTSSSGATLIFSVGLKSGGLNFINNNPEFNNLGSEFRHIEGATGSGASSDNGFRNERHVTIVAQGFGEHQQLTSTLTQDSYSTISSIFGAVFEIEP